MKKVSGKARSRVWLSLWLYIVVTGIYLFFTLIDATIGIKESIGQFFMLVFFWGWIALLYHIESKYFKGLYEKMKEEKD